MNQPTTIICIRHGETEWNLTGKIQGQLNSSLTPLGLQQATAASFTLQSLPIKAIYSSDLERTLQTARIIGKRLGLPIRIDDGIRERHFGIFQGLSFHDIPTAYPDVYREYRERNPQFTIPGGESLQQFYHRTIQRLESIATNHPGDQILVVAHGGTLDCLIRRTFKLPLGSRRSFSLKNTGINIFSYQNSDWRLETWGDINHLRNTSCS